MKGQGGGQVDGGGRFANSALSGWPGRQRLPHHDFCIIRRRVGRSRTLRFVNPSYLAPVPGNNGAVRLEPGSTSSSGANCPAGIAALLTTAIHGPACSNISPRTTSASIPAMRAARRARSQRRCERSRSVNLVSGHTTASTRPGKPTPEPRSTQADGGVGHPAAYPSESARCRSSMRFAFARPQTTGVNCFGPEPVLQAVEFGPHRCGQLKIEGITPNPRHRFT